MVIKSKLKLSLLVQMILEQTKYRLLQYVIGDLREVLPNSKHV